MFRSALDRIFALVRRWRDSKRKSQSLSFFVAFLLCRFRRVFPQSTGPTTFSVA